MSELITQEEIKNFLDIYKEHMLDKQQADTASNNDMRRTVLLYVDNVLIDAHCHYNYNNENNYDLLHMLVDVYDVSDETLDCHEPIFDFAVNLAKLKKITTLKFSKAEYKKFLTDAVVRHECEI